MTGWIRDRIKKFKKKEQMKESAHTQNSCFKEGQQEHF